MSHSLSVEPQVRWLIDGTLSGASLKGVSLMVTILLKPLANGGWSICRQQIILFSDLQLGPAIKLAREMARDEHQRLGRQVRVEMPGMLSTVVLANYSHDVAAPVHEADRQGTLAA